MGACSAHSSSSVELCSPFSTIQNSPANTGGSPSTSSGSQRNGRRCFVPIRLIRDSRRINFRDRSRIFGRFRSITGIELSLIFSARIRCDSTPWATTACTSYKKSEQWCDCPGELRSVSPSAYPRHSEGSEEPPSFLEFGILHGGLVEGFKMTFGDRSSNVTYPHHHGVVASSRHDLEDVSVSATKSAYESEWLFQSRV